MFTGIIRKLGTVKTSNGSRLEVLTDLKAARGDSIAVDGVCLTVIFRSAGRCIFDVSAHTRRVTGLGGLRPGDKVNLEPALRAGDALGGHLVSGHVDVPARVLELKPLPGGFKRLKVRLPPALRGLVAPRGSIAVDGVSLTVAGSGPAHFEAVLVPETLRETTLGSLSPGDCVNLEADLIARYVLSCLGRGRR